MQKGYFIDKNGEKQELPPELLEKIHLLEQTEKQKEDNKILTGKDFENKQSEENSSQKFAFKH